MDQQVVQGCERIMPTIHVPLSMNMSTSTDEESKWNKWLVARQSILRAGVLVSYGQVELAADLSSPSSIQVGINNEVN